MIEALIACVLLAIALALATSQVMRSITASNSMSTQVTGRAQVAELTERLGADVRGMRSKGRDGAQIADPIDLRRAVETNGTLRDLNGTVLDWRDVTHASPTQLTMQSDVIDETGSTSQPECVTWRVRGTTKWYIERTVHPYSIGCAGTGSTAAIETDRMTTPTSAAPRPGTAGVPPFLQYVLAERASLTGMRCHPTTVTGSTLSGIQRNRVTAVLVDVASVAQRREAASRAATRNEFSIRSRNAGDYQFAMGCAN